VLTTATKWNEARLAIEGKSHMNPAIDVAMIALLTPIVTAVVGAVGILIRDLYHRRSEMGRRKYAMDDATRQVTFAAEWWKAKQALGTTPDDQAARTIAESWLEEATSRVSEALQAPRRPDRSVTRRILLAYRFQRPTARFLRVVYYVLLAFTATGVLSSTSELSSDSPLSERIGFFIGAVVTYGLMAFAARAWAVSIEKRAAKGRTSKQPSVSAGGLIAPQPGWYPDPSGVPGQRYWDGQHWTAVAPGPNLKTDHPAVCPPPAAAPAAQSTNARPAGRSTPSHGLT
jgi:Protein of unknown function (DUF2510)